MNFVALIASLIKFNKIIKKKTKQNSIIFHVQKINKKCKTVYPAESYKLC